jgi:tetratricopeptide (TPR) repeat protein
LTAAEKVAADPGEDASSRARALLVAGRAWRMLGDGERAGQLFREALATATATGLTDEHAEALRRIGMEDYLHGHLREARDRFAEALQIARATSDRRGQAWALHNLAWVTTTLGDFTAAGASLAEAARLFAQLHDFTGRAWLRGTTAFTRLLAGQLTDARRLAAAFLPFGERVGERWAVGTLRAVDAFAAVELGDLAHAQAQVAQAYQEFEAIDDDWGRGLALTVSGLIARARGEAGLAVALLTRAHRYGEHTGHPLLVGIAATARGFALLDAGQPQAAQADALAVLEVVKPHDVTDSALVGPRVLLGLSRLALGQDDAAIAVLRLVAAAPQGPSLLMSRRLAMAEYAAALLAADRVDEALVMARRADALPAEDVRSRVRSAGVLAEALAATGARRQALRLARTALREALSTEHVSEQAAARRTLAALASSMPARPKPAAGSVA